MSAQPAEVSRDVLGIVFCETCQEDTMPDDRTGCCFFCGTQLVPPRPRQASVRLVEQTIALRDDSRANRRYDRCRARLAADGVLSLSFRCSRRAAVDVDGVGLCRQHADAAQSRGRVAIFPVRHESEA